LTSRFGRHTQLLRYFIIRSWSLSCCSFHLKTNRYCLCGYIVKIWKSCLIHIIPMLQVYGTLLSYPIHYFNNCVCLPNRFVKCWLLLYWYHHYFTNFIHNGLLRCLQKTYNWITNRKTYQCANSYVSRWYQCYLNLVLSCYSCSLNVGTMVCC